MLTSSLINMAFLIYCLAPSGVLSHLSGHAVQHEIGGQDMPSPWYMNDDVQYFPPAGQELPREDRIFAQKIVICEGTLSEKCGLGIESVKRPDQGIAALKSSASGFKSALALGTPIKSQTQETLPAATQWKDKFVVIWDDDKGVYFDGNFFSATEVGKSNCFLSFGSGEAITSVVFLPTEPCASHTTGFTFEPVSIYRPSSESRNDLKIDPYSDFQFDSYDHSALEFPCR